jgi:hypothetical protein
MAMPKKDHNPAAWATPSAARAVEANPNTIIPLKIATTPFLVIVTPFFEFFTFTRLYAYGLFALYSRNLPGQ